MNIASFLMIPLIVAGVNTETIAQSTQRPPGPDTLGANQIVVALGNSITQLGDSPRGYVTLMRKVLQSLAPEKNIIIVNSGISGHKATDMAARFDQDVIAFHPDWVTISVGINDVWHGFDETHPTGGGPRSVPLALFKVKVKEMVEEAYAAGIHVALFTTTVIQEDLNSAENKTLVDYNIALRNIASTYHCVLIDQNEAFHQALKPIQRPGMALSGALTVDGVHMLPPGDWMMARTALIAFGFSPMILEKAKTQINEAIESEEESSEDLAALRTQPRTLVFGVPNDGDRFQNLAQPDRYLVTGSFPHESLRQVAARIKDALTKDRCTHAVLFLDGCDDFLAGSQISSTESKAAFSKVRQVAAQYGVTLAIIGPDREGAGDQDWLADSCGRNRLAYFVPQVPGRPKEEQLCAWISKTVERPLIGVSASGPFLNSVKVMIQPLLACGEVRFTKDGTDPTRTSPLFAGPLTISGTTTINARLFYGSDDTSAVRTELFEEAKWLVPAPVQSTSPGLHYDYYQGAWDRLPNFDSLQAVGNGIIPEVGLAGVHARSTNWGVVLSGFVDAPSDGLYTWYLRSDDGSRLFIDGHMIADNDGLHGAVTIPGKIALKAGNHALKLLFFQREGGAFLSLEWKSGEIARGVIPTNAFKH